MARDQAGGSFLESWGDEELCIDTILTLTYIPMFAYSVEGKDARQQPKGENP